MIRVWLVANRAVVLKQEARGLSKLQRGLKRIYLKLLKIVVV